jgi:hypothetical protein
MQCDRGLPQCSVKEVYHNDRHCSEDVQARYGQPGACTIGFPLPRQKHELIKTMSSEARASQSGACTLMHCFASLSMITLLVSFVLVPLMLITRCGQSKACLLKTNSELNRSTEHSVLDKIA